VECCKARTQPHPRSLHNTIRTNTAAINSTIATNKLATCSVYDIAVNVRYTHAAHIAKSSSVQIVNGMGFVFIRCISYTV